MSEAEPFALIVAALDTKGEEAFFLKKRLEKSGLPVLLLDFGVFSDQAPAADFPPTLVAERGGAGLAVLRAARDRAAAIDVMMRGAAQVATDLHRKGKLAGVISVGGSGGTAVATAAMRALPLGVPKVMVSTVAASNVLPYVGGSDIAMLNSVTDASGVNALSAPILANAAGAFVGMVAAQRDPVQRAGRPLIAASMFGVTTPAVEQCRLLLAKAGYELVPFHATGIGGRTMEALIAEGHFTAVLDLTTTEWADEVVGGTLSAGPTRLEAAGTAGLPQVVAPGALDMVNFFGPGTFPEKFNQRLHHRYNDNVVLMRTTAAESAEIGRRIAAKLNDAKGPVSVLLPLRGISAMDAKGALFFDPDADAALFQALRTHLGAHVQIEMIDAHINDAAFAARCVERLLELITAKGKGYAQSHAG